MQLEVHLTADLEFQVQIPAWPHNLFMVIDHEIMSMVILPLLLLQVGQLLIADESVCTEYWLTI